MVKKANVLGTEYKIEVRKSDDEYLSKNHIDGFCCSVRKLIVIVDLDSVDYFLDYDEESKEQYRKQVLRHELTHAFLNESGLDCNSLEYSGSWSRNEEMVDWIAIQFPKMYQLFKECDCL